MSLFFCLTCTGVGAHYPSCQRPLPWQPGEPEDFFFRNGSDVREAHEYELAQALGIRGRIPAWSELLERVRLVRVAAFVRDAEKLLPKQSKKVAARKRARRAL